MNISKSGIIRTQKTVYNDVDFKVKFHGILSLFQAKYDTYEEMDKIYVKPKSSVSAFEIIHNSNYIKKLPATKAVKRNMKHYRLSTIDDVFNILAEGHEFKVRQ
ncbi:MAG: hypothetical protein LBF41_08675 [Deltaproteobacteria bacterium]|nr:hypothetical protein [Deltaproteobacteria bacterium]